ncbi:hypothetical protein [Cystobacter fuscus]|uniref:hypothetical protein n=1 Tax=Cystobacter fuscus TaxID=43 RepID=UPI0037C11BE0
MQADAEGAEHLVVVIRYLLWVGGEPVHEAAGQVLHSVLGRRRTEELMRSYGEQLIEQGLAQGLRQGRAEALLRILTVRGVQVDEVARQRILSCSDMATLDRWLDLSLKATTLSEVLDDLTQ